jgi:Calcineurin-like phosphoesterase
MNAVATTIGDVTDRDTIAAFVKIARRRLLDGKHDASAKRVADAWNIRTATAHDAAVRIAEELPADGVGPESREDAVGPFISRSPLVSVLQSELTEAATTGGHVVETPKDHRYQGLFSHILKDVRKLIGDGDSAEHDAEFGTEFVEGVLRRFVEGTYPFNSTPAECPLADRVRVIVVGDWGSGLPQAKQVAALMAQEVRSARETDLAVHVIHLGDVYFAGQAAEYRDHVLTAECWPVTNDDANAGVGSWLMAGNHDLYGGAAPYFDALRSDPRFRLQRCAEGHPTSWFRLVSPSLQIIGLDSAWNQDPFFTGQTGLLQEPQRQVVENWLRDGEPTAMLLSHHQFMSAYDHRLLDVATPPPLVAELSDLVERDRVRAWLWGHEHRCMAFTHAHLAYPACVGHGGQLEVPIPAGTQAPKIVRWAENATFMHGGRPWGRCGCVVLDIDGAQVEARYLLDGAKPVVKNEPM